MMYFNLFDITIHWRKYLYLVAPASRSEKLGAMYITGDYAKPLRAINALPPPTTRKVKAEGIAYLYTSPKTKLVSRVPPCSAHPSKTPCRTMQQEDTTPSQCIFIHWQRPSATIHIRMLLHFPRLGMPPRLRKSLEARSLRVSVGGFEVFGYEASCAG